MYTNQIFVASTPLDWLVAPKHIPYCTALVHTYYRTGAVLACAFPALMHIQVSRSR